MEQEEKLIFGETDLKLRIYRIKLGTTPANIRMYAFSIVRNDLSHVNEMSVHLVTAGTLSTAFIREVVRARLEYGITEGKVEFDGYHEVPIPFSREVRGSPEDSVTCNLSCYKKYASILISMLRPDVPGFLVIDYMESTELWRKFRRNGAMLRKFSDPNFSIITFSVVPLKGVSSDLEEMSKAILTRFLSPPPKLENWEYVLKVGKYEWLRKFYSPLFYMGVFLLIYIPHDLMRVFRIMTALKSVYPYPSLLDRHSYLWEVVDDKCVFVWKLLHSNVAVIQLPKKKRNHHNANLSYR